MLAQEYTEGSDKNDDVEPSDDSSFTLTSHEPHLQVTSTPCTVPGTKSNESDTNTIYTALLDSVGSNTLFPRHSTNGIFILVLRSHCCKQP